MLIIKQNNIKAWLKFIASQSKLLMASEDGDGILYTPYQEDLEPLMEGIPRLSAKGIVFPQTETMLEFSDTEGKKEVHAPFETLNTVIFGVRPCDAHGIAILEQVFTQGKHQDPYFKARREHTTVISVSCLTPPSQTCFCPTVGGSPVDNTGTDLLLTKVEDHFIAEAITPNGEVLIKNKDFFEAASLDDTDKLLKVKQAARDKMSECLPLDSKKKLAQHLEKIFLSDYWQQSAAACIGCNICTYLCPTCHCFNITDEMGTCKGKRIRTWDGCLSCQYTLEASGHNPRANKSQRYRNRINHKFSYLINNADIIGCVGCGRCIRNCPVFLDIRDVVKKAVDISAESSCK